MTGKAHHLIKELYIVYVPKFNPYGSIYPVLLESATIMVMYHRAVGTHLEHNKNIYTKLWKISEIQNQVFKQPYKWVEVLEVRLEYRYNDFTI